MKNNPTFAWVGTGVTGLLSYLSTQEFRDMLSWVMSIVAGAITIGFTIWCWYKKATSDGKITKEEVDELIEKASDIAKSVKEDKDNGTKD